MPAPTLALRTVSGLLLAALLGGCCGTRRACCCSPVSQVEQCTLEPATSYDFRSGPEEQRTQLMEMASSSGPLLTPVGLIPSKSGEHVVYLRLLSSGHFTLDVRYRESTQITGDWSVEPGIVNLHAHTPGERHLTVSRHTSRHRYFVIRDTSTNTFNVVMRRGFFLSPETTLPPGLD